MKTNVINVLPEFAHYIRQKKIHTDEYGNKFDEKDRFKVVARLYARSKKPIEWRNLGLLIQKKVITTYEDSFGQEHIVPSHERHEIAASFYRQAQTPEALTDLALLIKKGKTSYDESNQIIPQEETNTIAARLLLKTNIPFALTLLATWIIDESCDIDDAGNTILKRQHLVVGSKLLWKLAGLNNSEAMYELGWRILLKIVTIDADGNLIPEDKYYEVAATLFRNSKLLSAKNNLGYLILCHNILKDENNQEIKSQKQRIEAAKRLFQEANNPESLANLAFLSLCYEKQTLARKKEALELLAVSIQQGNINVIDYYSILKEEIEEQEGKNNQEREKARLRRTTKKAQKIAQKAMETIQETATSETTVHPQSSTPVETQGDIHAAIEAPLEEIETATTSTEAHRKLKAILKAQKEKHKDERKRRVKKLTEGKAAPEVIAALMRPQNPADKKVIWTKEAWEEFSSLPAKLSEKVKTLISDIKEGGRRGKPETLSSNSSNTEKELSRRITDGDRLVYKMKNGNILITHCKGHYDYMKK